SGDTIGFTLAGTVPWYSSSYSCKTESGSVSLWNQAASVAKSKLGYVAGKNNHLVLFFPSNIDCAGSIGLGSVGVSANTGGVAWVRGTDAPVEQASLAHELGHNMSLGHADWMLCSSATPNPGFLGTTGCTKYDYGDATDVMGFGTTGKTGGALSAPQAIRAGIWPSNAWETMLAGTTSRTINTVASNTGLRGLVVQDDNGVNYFIEYRNFDDEDAQYLGGSCTTSCVAPTGGVRVMRLENTGYKFASVPNGFLGFPGDDSYLMGRTISATPTSNLTN
ncbi:MAG: zinc-dependent metalloprotease family protein, partial [Leifsonia sp.]